MNYYAGLFFVAFLSLSLEITLVRLLSVTTWYHLAFFAISTAMLGITAGAARVYLRPRSFDQDKLDRAVSASCVHLALSIPVTLLILCLVPLGIYKSAMSLFALLITTAACALPYFFSGTIVTAVISKKNLPIGKLYASDLVGASLGCLFVLGGLEILDAPSLIILCSAIAALAAVCFAWKDTAAWSHRLGRALVFVFILAAVVNSLGTSGIRPVIIKGSRIEPANIYLHERWNSFSRIAVYPRKLEAPFYWGPSPIAPSTPVSQYLLNIDGEAGTTMVRFESPEDLNHLRYDVTNVGYYLGRGGKACVIGVGGGRDIQSAVLFGYNDITGIEINPIFIGLLQNEFRSFAGLADRPGVRLVKAEARGYLSQHPEKYSVIQMSLVDTWASTGAGAFSLSENSLYTVEAWKIFLERLADDGLFTISRWHSPENIGEMGRVLSLAVAALLRVGVQDPSQHLALITADRISTLLISRRPFPQEDIDKLRKICADLGFRSAYMRGLPPAEPLLNAIWSSKSMDQIQAAIASTELNYSPPTDESPYFFNMLRLRNIKKAFSLSGGVLSGNLIATITLLGLLLALVLLAVATVIVPLSLKKRSEGDRPVLLKRIWPGALYFSLIGCGFMLTEIALIQRLTVLLSHPIYALGILLFTLIISTGVGSFLSDCLPLTRRPWIHVYPVLTAVAILALSYLLAAKISGLASASLLPRIGVAVASIFPLGLLMGVFFPVGMRLTKEAASSETPWYLALNGIFGVLCSALAVLISIYIGISVNFYIAAACYTAVVIPQVALRRS
jgi:hypothetical protein